MLGLILLDTCVISELVSRRPNPAVVRWVDSLDDNRLYLGVVTRNERDFEGAGVAIVNPWDLTPT